MSGASPAPPVPPAAPSSPSSTAGGTAGPVGAVRGGILYAVVARGNVRLCEYAMRKGNYDEIVKVILSRIPTADSRKSFAHQTFIFHYVVSKGFVFLALADLDYGYRLPFLFLEDIQSRFMGTYSQALTAETLDMQQFESFVRILKEQMDNFTNRPHEVDKLTAARAEVETVKQMCTKNIDKVLERGDRIEALVEVTSQLESSSQSFRKKSTQLKRRMCRKNFKWTIITVVCIALIIAVLVVGLLLYLGVFK
eukprot:TRINITY_DN3177_c0_g1_i1.p1 TRINITY_DN3177_c0_g1~~TRINITY_DN3177_c0_g1_i1.p1  ORF type:complete len:282 (-),score=94.58 TRINITY_DN3177_c0_g1_i1:153-908(-)